MSSSTVNKVVLKSNTTMTLSDRFSDIMKMKSPKKSSVQNIRAEQSQLAQASAKNKRLAEQMARRSGVSAEAPVPAAAATTGSIKNRLGATKTVPTKARLGTIARGAGSGRGRGIYTRGRGMNKSPSSGFSPRGRGFQRGGQRGTARGGGGFNRGRNTWQAGNNTRGRGRGRGGQGAFRGRGAASKSSKEDLDKELDSYMGVSKKNHLSFDSADNWS